MYNNFNQEQYVRNLQNIKNETEQRLQQALQYQNITPNNTPSINQTFQLAPNQFNNSEYDTKTVKSVEEVKNALAMKTTLFLSDDKTKMWIKDVNGNIKAYALQEILQSRYDNALQTNNLQSQMSNNALQSQMQLAQCCDLKAEGLANTQKILDKMD